MSIDFKKELNENQYLAATSDAKHLRIIAGAGTGKTRTLTYRLAYLIARGDVIPSHIVAITFTNKVAREMRERVEKILGDNFSNVRFGPLITTFHGFCYRFLMKEFDKVDGLRKGFQIADDQDQKQVFKTVGEKFRYDVKSEEFKSQCNFVQKFKTEGKFVEDIVQADVWPHGNFRKVVDFYKAYQEELIKNNLVDFDDLLMYSYKVMLEHPEIRSYYHRIFDVFMVDEFQDTNDLQYKLVKLFMDSHTELCVVGDPDQTIYTWRGANNDIIKRDLYRDFKDLETVTLDLNYRSTQKILDKANELIRHNSDRVDKSLKAFSTEDGKDVELLINLNGDDEARNVGKRIVELHDIKGVKYKDIAIIYRSNFLSRTFEHTFANMRIPYELYGGIKFYERDEVKSALAYIKIAFNEDDNYSFERVLKNPSRGIGDKSLEELYRCANEKQLPLLGYLLSISSLDELPLTKSRKELISKLLKEYVKFRNVVTNSTDSDEIIKAIETYFDNTGFMEHVRGKDHKEGDLIKGTSREQNVRELIGTIKSYLDEGIEGSEETEEERNLLNFLINVALESAQDSIDDEDKVLVMTAHISKGLEFPYVFVTGLVEDVFPAIRSVIENGKEEERRLLYVAMTRAKKELTISTFRGFRFGNTENLPSSFLKELGFEDEIASSLSLRGSYGSSSNVNGLQYQRQRNQGYTSNEPRYTSGRPWKESNSELFERTGYEESEPYVEYSKPKELPKHMTVTKVNQVSNNDTYKVGDKIAHSSYGIGTVIQSDGKKIKVQFSEEYGVKTLIAGFKAFRKI